MEIDTRDLMAKLTHIISLMKWALQKILNFLVPLLPTTTAPEEPITEAPEDGE